MTLERAIGRSERGSAGFGMPIINVCLHEAGVRAVAQDVLHTYRRRCVAFSLICFRNIDSIPSKPGAVLEERALIVASNSLIVNYSDVNGVGRVYAL